MVKKSFLRCVLIGSGLAIMGCATIVANCPDGSSSATYKGTNLIGATSASCGTMNGVTTSTVTGADLAGLAQALIPILGGLGVGVPAAPAARPTTATAETQAR